MLCCDLAYHIKQAGAFSVYSGDVGIFIAHLWCLPVLYTEKYHVFCYIQNLRER